MFKGKKAVIFDLDGTLIDSIGIWNEVDKKLIKQLGHNIEDENYISNQREKSLEMYSNTEFPYLEYCGLLKEKYNSSLSKEEILNLRIEISQKYLIENIEYKENADKLLYYLKNKKM